MALETFDFCGILSYMTMVHTHAGSAGYYIEKAMRIMAESQDPMHENGHVSRVAETAVKLSRGMSLSEREREALVIAAWWHDTGRTVTKNPSLIWMPFFDDIISAVMLARDAMRGAGIFRSPAGLAARIISCKSLGTGQLLTRILLSKRHRALLDVLKDADALDVLSPERVEKIFTFVEDSATYHIGYRVMIWWMLRSHHLHVKTEAAKKYIAELFREFLAWVRGETVLAWHVEQFGEAWVEKTIARTEVLLRYFEARSMETA